MLGHKDYLRLLAQVNVPFKPLRQLRGSATLVGNLEVATKEISKLIQDSVRRTGYSCKFPVLN